MPLFEFRCRECDHTFEVLVRGTEMPACTSCGSRELDRLLSSFAVSSEGTRRLALAQGRKHYALKQRDQKIAEKEEREHHHH